MQFDYQCHALGKNQPFEDLNDLNYGGILWYKDGCASTMVEDLFCSASNCSINSQGSKLSDLLKFEGAAGELKGALGFQHPLISSPYSWPTLYFALIQLS